jgi:hypothetical protein
MAAGSISYRGQSLPILIARTERGAPNAIPVIMEEVLTTAGVDGKRWRTVNKQYVPTVLFTVVDCSTFAYAISNKAIAESFKGALVRLQLTLGGSPYAFRDAHVEDVQATAFPGPAVGEGATGTAHLVVLWTIVPTNFNASTLGD